MRKFPYLKVLKADPGFAKIKFFPNALYLK